MAHAGRKRVAVFGASGGIGAALVGALAARADVAEVFAVSRGKRVAGERVVSLLFDLRDERTIERAAASMGRGGTIDLCIVATGALTIPVGDGMPSGPEKSWRALDPQALAESFAINAIGPALVAKHVLPLLPKGDRSVFAALSARVGSIEDNRLGGWHSYRAAKAALNMLVRTVAIELARSHPRAIAATVHPGTVITGLSEPFLRNVPVARRVTAQQAADNILAVVESLAPADSGGFFAWDGTQIPF